MTRKKMTILALQDKKARGEPITMITAYDYPGALAADRAGLDSILVGDSLGMVVLGYDSTVPVTMDEMIHHCKAVRRGAQYAYLIGDLPFMSYQADRAEAVRNAGRFLKEAGMDAVKLEGGRQMADTVRAITDAGMTVIGHIGLTPQSVGQLSGYRVQGKTAADAERLLGDALALQAGRRGHDRAGDGAGPGRRADFAGAAHPHHRHRRGGRLRRPGAGAARHAGDLRPLHAEVRQEVRRAVPADGGRAGRLSRRRGRPALPGC